MATDNTQDDTGNGDHVEKGKSRHRSPNHPILDLPAAIDRAAAILNKDGFHWVPVKIAHQRWGYREFSGIGDQCVAALRGYGLLDVNGEGKQRTVRVSEVGRRIIKNAPDRESQIRTAALAPPIHAELWEKYKANGLPQNDVLRDYLLWDRPDGTFNENVVDGFIERLRTTLTFAKLESQDKIEEPQDDDIDDEEDGEMDPSDKKTDVQRRGDSGAGFSPPKPPGDTRPYPLYFTGSQGVLHVPSAMSRKDFELLKKQLANSLETIEATAVDDPAE